jgi:circadian clock protein KaiC
VSGVAGTGKSSLAAHLVDAACQRGERCLYIAYEESTNQIIRNMRSIGIDLGQWVEAGLLRFLATRPSFYSSELHLLTHKKATEEFQPSVIVVDPVTNLITIASEKEVKSMLLRMIDFYKMNQITALFTSLTHGGLDEESTDVGISSLMDTWILLREDESNGERNRLIYILKSRGLAHSNQIREFRLTNDRIQLMDVYIGPGGVLTGSARLSLEEGERAEALWKRQEIERRKRELDFKRQALQAQLSALKAEFESQEEELERIIREEEQREQIFLDARQDMAKARWAESANLGGDSPNEDGV